MRRIHLGGIALLLSLVACGGDDGRYSGDTSRSPGTQTSQLPQSPAQVGQAGQTSQQARRSIAEQPGGAQALSGTTGTASAASAQLTAAERAFIVDAAQHGMAEVQLGRLAEQKGSNASVRDFGRMMVQQHGQANQELMQIASRMGLSPPNSLPASGQAAHDQLQQLSGASFDRQYVEQQYAGHSSQLTMFRFTADNAANPELRSFAQKNVPVIQQHLELLRSMAPTVMRTGS
jgi:putative membrane protein